MPKSRWKIYADDLTRKGANYFVGSRMKKYALTRKLWNMGKKPYVMLEGKKLFVNKMDTVISEKLLETGVWEPFVTQIFLKYAQKAKLVVDVGANMGYYTILGSQFSKTVAFEPETVNFDLLSKSVIENNIKNVTAEKLAVGETNGRLKLYLDKDNFGDHRSFGKDGESYETVEVTTLDNYFGNKKEKIDLLKIDIQGYEVKAMNGARKLLQQGRIKVIVSELWPEGIRLAGDSWKKYVEILKKTGFKLWEIDEEKEKLVRFDEKRIEKGYRAEKMFTTNILGILS